MTPWYFYDSTAHRQRAPTAYTKLTRVSSQIGSSQPADEPDEPLRPVGSHEFRRTESNESVENRRQAGTADESLRPAPVDSRRNTTAAAAAADDGGGDDSESRRVELTESRRNDDVDDANESRRNDDGNEDGWWHRVSRPGDPSTMESRRRMLAAGMEAGTESRRGTAATAAAAPDTTLPRWWCRCSDLRRPLCTSQSVVTAKCTFSTEPLLVLGGSAPSASFTSSNSASSLLSAAAVAVICATERTCFAVYGRERKSAFAAEDDSRATAVNTTCNRTGRRHLRVYRSREHY